MLIKAVITADVVGSTKIDDSKYAEFSVLITNLVEEIEKVCPIKVEISRGDSFQLIVEEAEKSPLVAVLLRSGFRRSSLSDSHILDVRASIGVGTVAYMDEKIALSNGEAFVLSGREFDELGKQRLSVLSGSEAVNAELRVETAFVDDIISSWTKQQSDYMFLALLHDVKHGELASLTQTSRQNVAKVLSTAKEKLVRMYLDRVSSLIQSLK